MKTHVNEDCGECLKCQQSFKSYNECALHLQRLHKKSDEPMVACTVCSSNEENLFKNAIQFGKHLDEFHAQSFPSFRCNFCCYGFNNMMDLMSHKKGLHPTFPHHKCEKCGFKFFEKTVLDSHFMREHGSSTKTCDICFKLLRTTTRQAHMKIAHNMDEHGAELPPELSNERNKDDIEDQGEEKVYFCNFCHESFGGVSAQMKFKSHVKLLHGLDFKCYICGFVSSSQKGLNKHEKIHLMNADKEDATTEEKLLLEERSREDCGKRGPKFRNAKNIWEAVDNQSQSAQEIKKRLRAKFHSEKCALKKKLKDISEREEEGEDVKAEKKALEIKFEEFKDDFGTWLKKNKDSKMPNFPLEEIEDDSIADRREKSEKDWADWVESLESEVAIEPAMLALIRVYPQRIAVIAQSDPVFAERFQPKFHKNGKRKPRDVRVTCQICNTIISSRKNLKEHISGVHFGRRTTVCDACGVKLTNNSGLQRHQKICIPYLKGVKLPVTSPEVKDETNYAKFICSKCGIGMHSKEMLAGHMVM